jgi:hypothetical protein
MDRLDQEARESFFRKAHGLSSVTLGAIDRLLALGADERIHFEFTKNKEDDALLVTVASANSKAALFKVESTGRLMLLLSKQPKAEVRVALKELAESFYGRRPPDWPSSWEKRLPTIAPGDWEHRTDRMCELVQTLAAGGDVVALAEGFRQRRSAGQASAKVPGAEFARRDSGLVDREAASDGVSGAADQVQLAPPAPLSPNARAIVVTGTLKSVAEAPETSAPVGLTEHEIVSLAATIQDERVKKAVMRWARSRQSRFRTNLLHAYAGACCISDCQIDEVLEAAHIEDHTVNGDSTTSNGLLLRSDLHALFDAGLLLVDPETYTVRVDARLLRWYADFDGKRIRLPPDERLWPSREKLRARGSLTGRDVHDALRGVSGGNPRKR